MNDPALVRGYVRQVLSAAPRALNEFVIFSHVTKMTRDPLTVDELKAALAWNLARDYAIATHDEDTGCDHWRLTAKGRAKEGLA